MRDSILSYLVCAVLLGLIIFGACVIFRQPAPCCPDGKCPVVPAPAPIVPAPPAKPKRPCPSDQVEAMPVLTGSCGCRAGERCPCGPDCHCPR